MSAMLRWLLVLAIASLDGSFFFRAADDPRGSLCARYWTKSPAAVLLPAQSIPGPIILGPVGKLAQSICWPSASWQGQKRPLLHLPGRASQAFDRYQRHPECTRYLRLSRIAVDDQLSAKEPESRQSALLMDKHRQMAVKVVHLSIPLLEGNLGVDVCDSCRKDRQLYLWHP